MIAHLSWLRRSLLLAVVPVAACYVGALDGPAQLNAEVATPTCSAAATDPDGDGWGWEPGRSCIVDGSGIADARYPTCTAGAADPDGDGWGWEPPHSCRMDGGSAPTTSCAYVDGTCAPGSSGCAVYTDNGDRATVKREIWDAMYAENTYGVDGLDPMTAAVVRAEATCRADLAVAMAMQESHSFAVDSFGQLPYDWTKDGNTDGSQNVCVFNMNIDFIKRSCRTNCAAFEDFTNRENKKYLNQRTSLRECVRRLNEGLEHFGIDGSLYFHRGGSSGWSSPGDDERAFARAEKQAADHLRDVPERRTNGDRVSSNIEHR